MLQKKTILQQLSMVCLLGLAFFIMAPAGLADDKSAGSVSPVGSWFGNAISPTSGLEVVMMPTLFADGNLIANDSHEGINPHTTAHGSWVRLGAHKIRATFIWINVAPVGTPGNGVAGTGRITLIGEIDPKNQDEMTGTVHPIFFPPGVNPVTASDDDAVLDLGEFVIEKLQRIR